MLNGTDRRPRGECQYAHCSTGKLKGKQPELTVRRQAHLVEPHHSGKHTIVELAELFTVSRPTVCRVLERNRTLAASSAPAGR